jgi:hypothetical protein
MHVYVMIKKLIPFFFIFVTSLFPVFGENVRFYHHPDVSVLFQLNRDPRYVMKPQVEEQISYGFSLRLFHYFGIEIGFRVFNVHPSSLAGGTQYRGFAGFGPSAGLFGRYPFPGGGAAFRGFARFQPNFAAYYNINISFFYLSFQGGWGVELHLGRGGDWFLFAALPVSVNFRRDLSFSIAPGLSVSFHHQLLPWPYKQEEHVNG